MMTAIKIEEFKCPKCGRVELVSLRIETVRLKVVMIEVRKYEKN